MRKRTLQDKIGMAVMEKPGLNKKMLMVKKSLDEVNKVLGKFGEKRNRVCIYYALSLYIFRATSTKIPCRC